MGGKGAVEEKEWGIVAVWLDNSNTLEEMSVLSEHPSWKSHLGFAAGWEDRPGGREEGSRGGGGVRNLHGVTGQV